MNAPEPTYIMESPSKDYAAAVSSASDLASLRVVLEDWATYAPDAVTCAAEMTADDWPEFARGLALERSKKFAGQDWYDRFVAILLPERMVTASMLADQMCVPWGVAFIRLCEEEARAFAEAPVSESET
jgi:hypothetical protein